MVWRFCIPSSHAGRNRFLILALCFLVCQASTVQALTAAQWAAFTSASDRGIKQVACGDGEDCTAYRPVYPPRERDYLPPRREPDYEPPRRIERVERVEKVEKVETLCDRTAYAIYIERQREKRTRYIYTDREECGVRCWYKRLRNGYCGRGCDYYKFRLTEFPAGRFGPEHRRVVCW